MGTRNLTCVIKGGQFRVAQYGQWDGYPEGAGKNILQFLAIPGNIDKLRSRVDEITFISDEELENRMQVFGIGDSIVYGSEQERLYKEKFHWFNRDLGSKILDALVTTTNPVDLTDSCTFAQDSLFCEWAYVVDLDRNVLEVYKGFNKNPTANAGVFANVPREELKHRAEPYYGVVLAKSYSFDNLPTVEMMKKECDPKESEDE